ncbi:MAG: phospholipase A [Moraxella sp.]|nr:phospholipase A [Moraxella sp.]
MYLPKLTPCMMAMTALLPMSIQYVFAQTTGGVSTTQEVASFLQCAEIASDAARLACFDDVASNQEPSTLGQKRSLDLASTLKNAVTFKPQAVMVDDNQETDDASIQSGDEVYKDQLVSVSTRDNNVLTEIGLSKDALERYTPLSLAYDLDKNSERGLWSARPHNATYLLPMYFNAKPNRHPSTPTQDVADFTPNEMRVPELKFQISLKTKALENVFDTDADLWLGYTQQSHWQVYNEDNSRPFRVHDYEPEIFLTQPVSANLPFDGRLRMIGAGAVHHSNGESDPLSRSWNRAYIMGGAEWGNLTVMPRIWGRIFKKDGIKPDDNPDILDYYGYGDVKFLYQFDKGNNISGLLRYNPKTHKGAIQLDYVHPLSRGISGYVQIFQGYGQSLIDYNHEASSVGVGVMLTDWMGL